MFPAPEEEEEEDDDDDDLLPQPPIGLTIIDDAPDDFSFNPYEDPLFMTETIFNNHKNNNEYNVAPPENGELVPPPTKSYADIAKANTPKVEEPNFDELDKEFELLRDEASYRLCQFFMQGICRYGAGCRYVHGNTCESCQKPCLLPDNPQQNADHLGACKERSRMLIEREDSKTVECGICYEKVVEKGRRFGLLSHCEHSFCLECIREWRGSSGTSTNTVRSCPICRVTSYFIIPSEGLIIDAERKSEIIEQYKSKLSTITCKYFNKGKGTCKFGTSCMYSHLNSDGTPYTPPVSRKMQDSEGDVLWYNGLKLGMFMDDLP